MSRLKFDRNLVVEVGDRLRVSWDVVSLAELAGGMLVEQEHSDVVDPKNLQDLKAWMGYARIALAHLKEDPFYYTHLYEMERKYARRR